MGRRRNNGISEEKRDIIGKLISMYDIKSAADIQEALNNPYFFIRRRIFLMFMTTGGIRCSRRI